MHHDSRGVDNTIRSVGALLRVHFTLNICHVSVVEVVSNFL